MSLGTTAYDRRLVLNFYVAYKKNCVLLLTSSITTKSDSEDDKISLGTCKPTKSCVWSLSFSFLSHLPFISIYFRKSANNFRHAANHWSEQKFKIWPSTNVQSAADGKRKTFGWIVCVFQLIWFLLICENTVAIMYFSMCITIIFTVFTVHVIRASVQQ